MNHRWKTASLQTLIQYNKWLLISLGCLSLLSLLLSIVILNKEERWVLVPCHDIDRKMEISNQGLYPSYLKNWGIYIAKEVFTTSPSEVVNQHALIRKISATSTPLDKFFTEQLHFVQGNNASSVFFVKSATPVKGGVKVIGTLHYWFAGSEDIISYQEAARGLILLSNIEEDKDFSNKGS
jgi:hypothetical protein